ncbi:hypothetical protein [Halomonas korlensis]|uniref:Cyd operon protein YbgE (Cyd_oper_YbgE) n=1 Tax=Halomonas korlensis TaxID=463301 RepID=A0A1I7JLR9_9GAMM|nr:hypothetical protein [Halomonas korlensis]SFU86124.1 hypothetical protein SAMN04487955_11154 [Halomonas korlensis]
MIIETRQQQPGIALLVMLVAAGLAIWLLLEPTLLRGLSLPLRLPLIGLGVWALGAAFTHGMGVKVRGRWLRRAVSPLWSRLALVVFALTLVIRALVI